MESVAAVLGYDHVADGIAEALRECDDANVVEGPPGVGKSWLALGIGGLWEQGGGTAVCAEGDMLQSDVPFYPLQRVLAALASSWKTVGAGLARIAGASEELAGTAGIITATIQTLVSLRPSRTNARRLYLGKAEQDILFDLERLARDRPLLIIADNLHWWDADSLKLLGRLREPGMADAFPFLSNLRLIAVRTLASYEPPANRAACEALLARGDTRYHRLSRPSRALFPEVLIALGAPAEPAAELADSIFDLTGGHLALASRCAKRVQLEGMLPLSGTTDEEFIARLLTDRVRSLGVIGSSTLTILQTAAVLGLQFRRIEVACAMGGDGAEAARLLRSCRDEEVIELTEDVGRFAHDLFRRYFLAGGTRDVASIHENISECLRILRPGDYEERARHALQAERLREAAAYGVQAALVRMREGLSWRGLTADVLAAIAQGEMDGLVKEFEGSFRDLQAERASECLAKIERLPRRLPRSLTAEIDLIRSTALLSTRSEADRERALSVLEAWAGYETEEPELGIRIMRSRLYAMSLVVDKAPARALDLRIRHLLGERVDTDPSAEDEIYTLDRCSGSVDEPEVSLGRIRDATRHYAPRAGQTVVRRPIEYYKCLVNLASKLLTTAAYEAARDVYAQLDTLIDEFGPDTFPRLDFPRSGSVLADFRVGVIDSSAAARLQRQIVDAHQPPDDPFYAQNALAVYSVLDGDGQAALEVFESLEAELARRLRPAPSTLYLIRANRCSAMYVSGERESALREWLSLADVVRRIPYVISRYLIARHDLITGVMKRQEALHPVAFDECVLEANRFGPLWNQLGRGFRMPEVEWWS